MLVSRLALKFGYNGRGFSGYAFQNINRPVRTVEGSILEALRTVLDPKGSGSLAGFQKRIGLSSASRTDKGVSALGNVLVLRTDRRPEELLKALNALVENCFFWAWADVDSGFRARHADSRWYRYYLPQDYDDQELRRLETAAITFWGKFDFSRFSKPDPSRPERTTVREMELVEIRREKGYVIVDVKAQSFLWHQVRMMVWTMDRAARGEVTINEIYNELTEEAEELSIGLAPPEPLVLMDVNYRDLEFTRVRGLKKKDWARKQLELREELNFLDLAMGRLM